MRVGRSRAGRSVGRVGGVRQRGTCGESFCAVGLDNVIWGRIWSCSDVGVVVCG